MRAVLLGGVAGVAVIAAVITVHGNGQDTIYTLAAIQTGRARHPQAWTGRRVLVRGRITIAYALQPARGVIWWLPTDCAALSACLSDYQIRSLAPHGAVLHLLLRPTSLRIPGTQPFLVLRPPPLASAFGALTRLPLLVRLLPVAAEARWGAGRVYRIEVYAARPAACKPLECDDGQLLGVVR